MQKSRKKKTPWKYLMVFLGFFGLASAAGCGGGGGGGNATPGNPVSIGSVTPSQKDQGYRTEATLHICRYGVSSGSYITILWGDQAQPTQGERSDWTSDGCRDYVHYFYKNGDFPYTVTGVNPAVNGGTGTFKVTVTPQNNPTATLTDLNCPSPVYLNQKAACTATTSNGQGTVEINFGESNRQPVQATSGVPVEFSYNSTGTFTVTAVMSGIGGTPKTTAIQVVPSPASNLRTPTFASGFVLRPLQLGTSMCFSLGNMSGRTKSVRVQNGTTHEYSYGGQNPFSVCPPLTGEGHTDFSFRAIGNPGEMSDPLTTSVEHFSQNPLPALPDVFCDIDPNNNAQALCEVTKYLGFELWVRPPGGTDSLVPGGGRSSAYTGTDYLNQVTLTHPVALQGTTGAQSICFFHRLDGHIDQSATTRKSTELCRTVNTVNNGGTGGGTNNTQAPQGSIVLSSVSGNSVTLQVSCSPNGNSNLTGTVSVGGQTQTPGCTNTNVSFSGLSNGSQTATWTVSGNGGSNTYTTTFTVNGTGGGTGGTFGHTGLNADIRQGEDLTTDGSSLYTINGNTGCIYKYSQTGTSQTFPCPVNGLPNGESMSSGGGSITYCPTGDLYVSAQSKIYRVSTSGTYISKAPTTFSSISGMGCKTVNGSTRLYVTDSGGSGNLYALDATTMGVQWNTQVGVTADVDVDRNGTVYYLSYGSGNNGRVGRLDSNGQALGSIGQNNLSLPYRILITSYDGTNDTLLISENGTSKILVMDTGGGISTSFGGAGSGTGLTNNVFGLVVIGSTEFVATNSHPSSSSTGRLLGF